MNFSLNTLTQKRSEPGSKPEVTQKWFGSEMRGSYKRRVLVFLKGEIYCFPDFSLSECFCYGWTERRLEVLC